MMKTFRPLKGFGDSYPEGMKRSRWTTHKTGWLKADKGIELRDQGRWTTRRGWVPIIKERKMTGKEETAAPCHRANVT